VDHAPVDRDATLALARHARRLLLKTATDVIRVDADHTSFDDPRVARALVHEDGLMRVPILVVGDVLVRGYTEELYAEVLAAFGVRGGKGFPIH
jgi:arsenate reductase-like glutaredoxin family protein